MMLKSFSTNGGKGMLAPAAPGRFASNADRSTSKKESTPAMPAIHRIANSLVLNFIRTVPQRFARRANDQVQQGAGWRDFTFRKAVMPAPLLQRLVRPDNLESCRSSLRKSRCVP